MKKIQEAIYFKRVDFNDLFYPQDRRLTGSVSPSVFLSGLRRARVTLNDGEIAEIIEAAPKDPQGNIFYKDYQRTLSRLELSKAIHKNEVSSFTIEKVACAVCEFINEVRNPMLTIEDLRFLIRKTWLQVPPDELRQVWDLIPHDKISLSAWAKQNSVPVPSFIIPKRVESQPSHPSILKKLREIAVTYGNQMLIQAFTAKEVLFMEDLVKLLEKFRVVTGREEFDEFRQWAIDNEIMKKYGNVLGFSSQAISQYFAGLVTVEKQYFESDLPVLNQILAKVIRGFVSDKLLALKKCLIPFVNRDYIEEIRLREVFTSVIPEFTNENISLIVNSLKFTIAPFNEVPFRQINIPELISLFDNSDFSILPSAVQVPLPPPLPSPATSTISESFLVKPRDYTWEKSIISKVFQVSQPLLANFRINDYNQSGALTLEVFHYALKKSLGWLGDEEIFFIVGLALRECGCIDEQRSFNMKKDLRSYHEGQSISAAWFPEGDQYNISYIYFFVVLEKLSAD